MAKKFEIATIKETDPVKFDDKVNQKIADGYYLRKRKFVTLNDQGLVFVAFLDRKSKIKPNFKSVSKTKSKKKYSEELIEDDTPDMLDPENPDFSNLELD